MLCYPCYAVLLERLGRWGGCFRRAGLNCAGFVQCRAVLRCAALKRLDWSARCALLRCAVLCWVVLFMPLFLMFPFQEGKGEPTWRPAREELSRSALGM